MLQCASLKNISHSWRWQQEEKQRGMVTYQSMSMSGVHGIINQTEILWLFLTSWQTPPCGCPNVSVCQWGKVLDREEQSPSSNPLGVLMFFTDLINMYKYVPLQCPAGGGVLWRYGVEAVCYNWSKESRAGGEPRADPGHAAEITSLCEDGKLTAGAGGKRMRRGQSGLPCWNSCPHDPDPDKQRQKG